MEVYFNRSGSLIVNDMTYEALLIILDACVSEYACAISAFRHNPAEKTFSIIMYGYEDKLNQLYEYILGLEPEDIDGK